jgi:hypothetical protein
MHFSAIIAVATLASSVFAGSLLPRESTCESYTLTACQDAEDQFCCSDQGHSEEYVTCDHAGDNFYVAGCSTGQPCQQNDDNTITCGSGSDGSD